MQISQRVDKIGRALAVTALLGSAVMFSACSAVASAAKEDNKFPEKAVWFVNPYRPGGAWDGMVNGIIDTNKQYSFFPHPFVLENLVGADGAAGREQVASMKADGYSITIAEDAMLYQDIVGDTKTPYDQYTYIARLIQDHTMLVVKADSPFQNWKDVFEASKASPNGLRIAGKRTASVDQLHTQTLVKATGANLKYSPFPGSNQVVSEVVAGNFDLGILNPVEARDALKAGKLRGIAVHSDQRLKGLDVPTLKEQGVNLVLSQFRGLAGPKNISAGALGGLESRFKKITDTPEWQKYLADAYQLNGYMPSSEFTKHVQQLYPQAQTQLKELGLSKK